MNIKLIKGGEMYLITEVIINQDKKQVTYNASNEHSLTIPLNGNEELHRDIKIPGPEKLPRLEAKNDTEHSQGIRGTSGEGQEKPGADKSTDKPVS